MASGTPAAMARVSTALVVRFMLNISVTRVQMLRRDEAPASTTPGAPAGAESAYTVGRPRISTCEGVYREPGQIGTVRRQYRVWTM
jgi:hypothetical protein